MEPFVIGSLWGALSDDKATLVSTGASFTLRTTSKTYEARSLPANFFDPSANTSVFTNDVTFVEDIDGIGSKAGKRVAW
jgi:hypothetical protein